MPTPFYHISLAEDLLTHLALPDEVRQFLTLNRCTFLFGNTAPDVQVVSGQLRQVTHFFDLPIQENAPFPWKLMLSSYPNLSKAGQLSKQRAAFVAGYLCHLQADWIWVREIFAPVFGPGSSWGSFRERLYLHNVLRAYLDVHILKRLNSGMDTCLSQVEPDGWLPFVDDYQLIKWRDTLFPQLQPGAATQTVEVFSSRGSKPASEFYTMLESEERMQQEVFEHIPLEQVNNYHQRVLEENLCLLSDYLALPLQSISTTYQGNKYKGVQP